MQAKINHVEQSLLLYTAQIRDIGHLQEIQDVFRNVDHIGHLLAALEEVSAIDDCSGEEGKECKDSVLGQLLGSTYLTRVEEGDHLDSQSAPTHLPVLRESSIEDSAEPIDSSSDRNQQSDGAGSGAMDGMNLDELE